MRGAGKKPEWPSVGQIPTTITAHAAELKKNIEALRTRVVPEYEKHPGHAIPFPIADSMLSSWEAFMEKAE